MGHFLAAPLSQGGEVGSYWQTELQGWGGRGWSAWLMSPRVSFMARGLG